MRALFEKAKIFFNRAANGAAAPDAASAGNADNSAAASNSPTGNNAAADHLAAALALINNDRPIGPDERSALNALIRGAQKQTRELERNNALLKQAACTDNLTGCLNRTGLELGFLSICEKLSHNGDPAGIAVIAFDLNGLKSINDTHGHHAGDRLIRGFAEALQSLARPQDLVARLGGDEFAMVLAGVDEATATARAAEIALAINGAPGRPGMTILSYQAPEDNPGLTLVFPLSTSYGMAHHPGMNGPQLEERLRLADAALYANKTEHKARKAQERMEMQATRPTGLPHDIRVWGKGTPLLAPARG